ncbi:MAG: nucleotide exchange factor GrpE [Clostridia bacterium]|nr:nucleotide exchange factor GrpE [Clostridia bacterium]
MSKKNIEQESKRIEENEDMIRMFKDDFDAMQQEAATLEGENAALKGENERLNGALTEMTAQAQRLQAEFENYRKRTNETNKRVRIDGSVDVLEKMLPVLDALEQARGMIKDESTLSGLQIISRQLDALLAAFDVKQFESLGVEFDPNFHNAIMEEDAPDDQKGKVVKVYQQGYQMGDKILRYAAVIVGK